MLLGILGFNYLIDIQKEVRKGIGYFVLTVKVTGTHFSHKSKVSLTNSFHDKLIPYPYRIWAPQDFPLWKDRMEFPFQVTI